MKTKLVLVLMGICILTGCTGNNTDSVCETKVQSVDYTPDHTLIIDMSSVVLDNECIKYSLQIPVDIENNEFSFYSIVNEDTGVVRDDKYYVFKQYGIQSKDQPEITGKLVSFNPDSKIENRLSVFVNYVVNGEQEVSDLISVDFSDLDDVKAELTEHLNK